MNQPSEQDVLAELNRVRTNPSAYADWLETWRSHYDAQILSLPQERPIRTREGAAALEEAIAFLRTQPAVSAVTLSAGMSRGAADQARDQGQSGATGSNGSDGSTVGDRLNRYGQWGGSAAELVSYGKQTAAAVVALLLVNDGDPQRQVRRELLNPNFQVVGIACGGHPVHQTLCVLDFAAQFREQGEREPDAFILPSGPSGQVSTAELPTVLTAITSTSYLSNLPPADYLSPLELELIAEVNRLRDHPQAYADELTNLRRYYKGTMLQLPGGNVRVETHEGVAAVDEAIAALQRAPQVPLLSPARGLSLAARDHANDLGQTGQTGHIGRDGSRPSERISRYGQWQLVPGESVSSENISFSPFNSARWHVLQWLIDDGVGDRGHRNALLQSDYRLTGAACGDHPTYGFVCVMEYASHYTDR